MNQYISFPGLGIDLFHMDKSFSVFGRDIAWYGVIICFGIILAVTYALLRAKYTEKISVDSLTDLAFFLVFFGILGARLYYVIFEFDKYVVTGKGFFGNILGTLENAVAVWEGGLAIYGAIIAGFVTILIFCKIKKLNLMKVLDLAAPAVMIGQLIGRWGNFVNVEAYGAETTLPWRMGIHTPSQRFENAAELGIWKSEIYVHPTFLYESLWNLLGFVIANLIYRKKKYNGQIFYFYLGWYGFGRMLIEGLRADSLYLGPIRISQLIGLVTFLIGAGMFFFLLKCDKVESANALDSAVPAVGEESGEAETEESVEETTEETGDENGKDN